METINQNPPPPNAQAGVGGNTATPGIFVDDPRLWEGLPSQTNRYDDVFAGPRSYRTILPGSASFLSETDEDARPPVLPVPVGWEQYIHPVEGRPYFYQPALRIVTEIYIRHPGQLGHIMEWYNVFVALRNHVLPGASAFDVYLDCNGRDTCRYYMIDHANKTVCWLRQRTTSEINISDVRSTMGLRALLNEEYWTHAEYMPKNENHLAATRAELQGSLAASLLDHMTSEGSTSPFTKAECESYLFALNKAAESGYMIHLNWSIARVMGLLVHSRNVNLYGQYGARLDRTATVEDKRHPARSSSYLYRNALLGGGPIIHLTRLENLWVDRIIYTHHWRALLHDLYQEWTMAAGGAGVMWASNMVFVASPGVDLLTKFVCAGSGILAGASGVYALSMLRDHRALGKYAAHAANYFQQHEHHATGLQELSIKYSLPWAGVIWSFGITCGAVVLFFVSSVLLLLGSYTHVLVTIVLVAGVYVHARGVAPFLRDTRNFLRRIGLGTFFPPSPASRGSKARDSDEPPELELPPRYS
ncbi:hypothetical protein FRC08_009617 [Ceratobasidium sp. 394]|nr:hypothetical protein FRC08_009617 [Ceratobasidium sp. 394]